MEGGRQEKARGESQKAESERGATEEHFHSKQGGRLWKGDGAIMI